MDILGLIISGLLSLLFGGMIIVSQPGLASARFFFLNTVGIAAWALGIALFLSSSTVEAALPFVQLYYVGAALIAVAMLSVAVVLGRSTTRYRHWLLGGWLLFGLLALLLITVPHLMIEVVVIGQRNTVLLQSLGYAVYAAYFLVCFVVTIGVLLQRVQQEPSRLLRKQLLWLLYAYGPAGLIGAWFNLILPGFGNYELIWAGPLSVFLFVPMAYAAVAWYGLFDLRGAAVRTISYGLALAALALVYYGLAYLAATFLAALGMGPGVRFEPIHIALALVIALIFQPVKQFFDRMTDRLFYRHEYDREKFFIELGGLLANGGDMDVLLRRVALFLKRVFKADRLSFAVVHDQAVHVVGAQGFSRIPAADSRRLLSLARQQTAEGNRVVVTDTAQHHELRTLGRLHGVALVLPLTLEKEVIGCLFLGEHKGRGYTARDIKLLEAASGELVIALKNALSVEEVKELNSSLRQRVADATKELRASNHQLQRLDEAKNEFISMASHQLRTPLTSIKGYLDMVLEGDLGKINATQKTVLTEAFSSSERMVQLINDFLNVSRLQTGKFMIDRHPSNLAALVREEVALLKVVAKQREVRLRTSLARLPHIAIDADKFRQVILNMIDNAIYYSPPGSMVRITLTREGDMAVFTVTDAGIGVPADEQAHLFGKFFRASNARKRRPDGTGIGLFLARKVVLAHGGSMVFESAEGQGSTFGFRVPLAQPMGQKTAV